MNAAAPAPKAALSTDLPPRPYPGLRPFKTSEWRIFCGRESVTREVIRKLGDNNVVMVHGGSGCGKSSLIAAGVLPSLERDVELAGGRLVSATIRPSQGPLAALAATLAELLGPVPEASPPRGKRKPAETREGPAWSTATAGWTTALLMATDIVERIEAAIAAKDADPEQKIDLLCLVIDQFEEIFPWARERRASDVEAMCRLLAALARPREGRRLVIVATMRSDFIGQCAQFPALGEVINTCQYFLRGLDDPMLERAIRDPAKLFGGTVDDALVTRLKTEANGALDALPVLQHALMRMAAPKLRGTRDWQLTLDDYRKVTTEPAGGSAPPTFLSNALSVHAEEVRATLVAADPHAAGAVEAVFRALFESGVGGQLVRRPTAPDKLAELAGEASSAVAQVVADYAREGTDLLFEIKDPAGQTIKVDVVHEALLRNWWRMKFGENGQGPGWIEAEAIDALVWRNLVFRAGDAEDSLDRRALARIAEPLAGFRAAPARAERYLLRKENRENVADEPEWQAVMALIERSERRLKNRRRWLATASLVVVLVIVGLIGSAIWWTIAEQTKLGVQDKIRDEVVTVAPERADGREQSLTTYQADVIEQFTEENTGAAEVGQYIWIGDGTPSNLTTYLPNTPSLEEPVAASAIVGKTQYRVVVNVALRAAMPDERNSSQRTGALLAGTPVLALRTAEKSKNGQNWLKVSPLQIATVYIQYASGDPAADRQQLINAGFKVPPAQQIDTAKGANDVRYCNRADAKNAVAVATALAEQRGAPLPTRWIGEDGACQRKVAPGTIEVWVDQAD